ncbi:hypothetical protein HY250_04680 [Candidatus Azambacteria bacterium]|nr:hypothetical protein [Candidatus Azambacteria bacterium]
MEIGEKVSARIVKKTAAGGTERSIIKKSILIVIAVLLLAAIDANYNISSSFGATAAAKGKWQAVFLTNGQVYFGHLSPYGFHSFVLNNVYYVRSSRVSAAAPAEKDKNAKNAAEEQPQAETRNELVKISQDLHGPEDTMFIPKTQILFWQNLRDDSQIVATIKSSPR